MESLLEDRQKCSAPQPDDNSNGVTEAQSSHKTWDKPVKLAFLQGGLLRHHSAKRELFTSGRNMTKDIKNRAPARKTLSHLPTHRPTYTVRRQSGTYKVPSAKASITVNRSKPNVGQGQHLNTDTKLYQRGTLGPIILGSNGSAQKIPARSTKKEGTKIAAVRSENQSSSVMAPPFRPLKIGGKVPRHVRHLENLENSVNLLNVDDVEEKLMKESSLLKSQILKKENTKGVSSCSVKNEQKNCNDQISNFETLKLMDEKMKHFDEKQEKVLSELANLTELVKNLFSNQEVVCRNCSCHCHNTHKAVIKTNDSTTTNNSGHKATSDEQNFVCSETNRVPGSEIEPCSVRRSLRLQSKGAQYVYESLRKSTKLLSTPRPCSAKKANTPSSISRKVIAQLNDLYND